LKEGEVAGGGLNEDERDELNRPRKESRLPRMEKDI
jgi:hypothetical protein